MADQPTLSRLSPAALKAAMEGGAAEWGQWGSAEHHRLYVEPIQQSEWPMRKRRMCRCGCQKRYTHRVAANGVTLGAGCEMAARRAKREMEAAYGKRA